MKSASRLSSVLIFAFALTGTGFGQPMVVAVVNAASFKATVSPGCLVSIFGSNLSSGEASAMSTPLPTSLGGVSISIAGIPAPLLLYRRFRSTL